MIPSCLHSKLVANGLISPAAEAILNASFHLHLFYASCQFFCRKRNAAGCIYSCSVHVQSQSHWFYYAGSPSCVKPFHLKRRHKDLPYFWDSVLRGNHQPGEHECLWWDVKSDVVESWGSRGCSPLEGRQSPGLTQPRRYWASGMCLVWPEPCCEICRASESGPYRKVFGTTHVLDYRGFQI